MSTFHIKIRRCRVSVFLWSSDVLWSALLTGLFGNCGVDYTTWIYLLLSLLFEAGNVLCAETVLYGYEETVRACIWLLVWAVLKSEQQQMFEAYERLNCRATKRTLQQRRKSYWCGLAMEWLAQQYRRIIRKFLTLSQNRLFQHFSAIDILDGYSLKIWFVSSFVQHVITNL